MKRSIKFLTVLVLSILMGSGTVAWAQDQSTKESRSVSITTTDEGKIKLKVITKKGDDQQIFEKTYDSYEDMKGDPELEAYGIEPDDWHFRGGGFSFGSPNARFFLHRGPGMHFWHDDDDSGAHSFRFDFDTDSLREHIHDWMKKGFHFDFDEDGFIMDFDTFRDRFDFDFDLDGNHFFFDGDEWMDKDSLEDAIRDKLDKFHFDFDFDRGSGMYHWRSDDNDKDHDDKVRIISRARVFIRAAKDADKKAAGTDQMKALEIRDISFYPNPSDGRFSVEVDTGSKNPLQVKIIDPNGGVVYHKTDPSGNGPYKFNIDISHQPEGIYILQVIQNNRALTRRVIIE